MDEVKTKPGARYLTCKELAGLDFLVHGFGTREAEVNRAMGIAKTRVFAVNQVHGNRVVVVGEQQISNWRRGQLKQPVSADALLTNQPEVALAVFTADCLPIIIADPQKMAIAIVHAGWRGTWQGITQRMLARLAEYSSGSPANWLVGMGPCIGSCCYEVGKEVVDIFSQRFSDWRAYCAPGEEDKWRLDLIAANRAQLLEGGIRAENIGELGWCTACHPEYFFSHRRTPQATERMMSLVMLKAGHNPESYQAS